MAVSYARRQQLRQLKRAALHAVGASMTLTGAAVVAYAGNGTLALMLVLLTCVPVLASRRSWQLAARSRVGTVSEAQVRRALRPLRSEGWQVQHASDWPSTGDLDHIVRSPMGIGFLIETKTRHYTPAHIGRTVAAAHWLARRRARYPAGVRPVICIARARAVETAHAGVLIVSPDRLVPALRAACSSSPDPCARIATTARPVRGRRHPPPTQAAARVTDSGRATATTRGCRISPPRRAAPEARTQMRRSNGFCEGAETNQSPGNRPWLDAPDLCDSLTRKEQSRLRGRGASFAWRLSHKPVYEPVRQSVVGQQSSLRPSELVLVGRRHRKSDM